MNEIKSVNEILTEACEEICDDICFYRRVYSPTNIEMIDDDYLGRLMTEHCEDCVLKRLVKC